jgi:hypothetical protein
MVLCDRHPPVLSDGLGLKVATGGVVIVSKYPILYQQQHVFHGNCEGYDCFACKGVVFCRIVKDGNVVNVVGTHFQAWDTPRAKEIRMGQAQACQQLVASLAIPADEPIVLVGDWNLDLYTRQAELQRLSAVLQMTVVAQRTGSYEFTTDPSSNNIVGNDEDVMYATARYPQGCYTEYMDTLHCPCCPQEWLDYVAFSTVHLAPCQADMRVVQLKQERPFRMMFNLTMERETTDLSDHYPVIGTFHFAQATPYAHRRLLSSLPVPSTVSAEWCTVFQVVFGVVVVGVVLLGVVLFRRRRRVTKSLVAT